MAISMGLLFVEGQIVVAQNDTFNPDCGIELIGHRGYSGLFPENTLIALEEAFKAGIKICEVDVNQTADGVAVLFHDQPTMSRTAGISSDIRDLTWEEIQTLEVGSWKSSVFQGEPIPSLEQALLLAEQYDAQLYLDTKGWHPLAYAQALEASGVQAHRLVPAVGNILEVIEFKTYCPNSPYVYFGDWQGALINPGYWLQLAETGCQAVEIYYESALENTEDFLDLKQSLEGMPMEIWTFTSNELSEILVLEANGVQAVETDWAPEFMPYICSDSIPSIPFQWNQTTGSWNFQLGNLNAKSIGSSLKWIGSLENDELPIGFNHTFGLPGMDGETVALAAIPAFGPNEGLFVYSNISPEGHAGGDYTSTIGLDLYIPASSTGEYIALFQTNPDNSNDADLFIHPNLSIGANGKYVGQIVPDQWMRLVWTVSHDSIHVFIDGQGQGAIPIEGFRWSIVNTFPGGDQQGFMLFADDNGETKPCYIAAIELRNYVLSPEEVEGLGGPKSSGFPVKSGMVYFPESGRFGEEVKLNITNRTIDYPFYSFDFNQLFFELQEGDKAQEASGLILDTLQNHFLLITSPDGSVENWKIIPGVRDLSIEEFDKDYLAVYPNPSLGRITISNTSRETQRVEVFNAYGIQVHSFQLKPFSDLNLRLNVPAGTYFYRGNNSQRGSFVVL